MPGRISETLVSCRDLIRRQHQRCIALPPLSASTDVQEVHTRVIMLSLCVFSMSICYLSRSMHLPCVTPRHSPVKILPKPVRKSSDEEVQGYMCSHSSLCGGGFATYSFFIADAAIITNVIIREKARISAVLYWEAFLIAVKKPSLRNCFYMLCWFWTLMDILPSKGSMIEVWVIKRSLCGIGRATCGSTAISTKSPFSLWCDWIFSSVAVLHSTFSNEEEVTVQSTFPNTSWRAVSGRVLHTDPGK